MIKIIFELAVRQSDGMIRHLCLSIQQDEHVPHCVKYIRLEDVYLVLIKLNACDLRLCEFTSEIAENVGM